MQISDFTQRLAVLQRIPEDRRERAQTIAEQLAEEDRRELIEEFEKLDKELLDILEQEQEYAEKLEHLNVLLEKKVNAMSRVGAEATEKQEEEKELRTFFDDA